MSYAAQQITFGYERAADWANHDERNREVAVLLGIETDLWSAPSRCAGWTIHDVVRHVVHMNETLLGAIAAARAGERHDRLRGFDPLQTPGRWLVEEGTPGPSPDQTLAAYTASTEEVVRVIDGLDGSELAVMTPTGKQPWQRAALHGIFDAAVHERDITEPLGRSHPPFPTHEPVLAYALLLAARAACAAGAEFDLTLDLGDDLTALAVSVAGNAVTVVATDTGRVRADPLALLDGLTGRARLDAVLAGPAAAVDGLGRLASLL